MKCQLLMNCLAFCGAPHVAQAHDDVVFVLGFSGLECVLRKAHQA